MAHRGLTDYYSGRPVWCSRSPDLWYWVGTRHAAPRKKLHTVDHNKAPVLSCRTCRQSFPSRMMNMLTFAECGCTARATSVQADFVLIFTKLVCERRSLSTLIGRLQVHRLIVCRPSHAKHGRTRASGQRETWMSTPSHVECIVRYVSLSRPALLHGHAHALMHTGPHVYK